MPWLQELLPVQFRHGFEQHIAHDLEALCAELVERVVGGVPVGAVGAVIEINQVRRRDACGEERQVVVGDGLRGI